LAAFGALDQAEADRFVKAVQEAKPRLVVEEFAAEVASVCGMSADKVRSFVSAFFGVYLVRIRSGRSLEGFVSDLLAALQKTKGEISDPDSFSRRVKALLQADDSLGIAAKALGLLADQERTFHSCRILSDVRYIFGDNPSAPPKAAVVAHSLNLVYGEMDGMKQMYVAVDGSDLKRLKAAIERAEAKELNLRSMLQKQGTNCLQSAT